MTKTKQKRTPRVEDGASVTSITGRRIPIHLVDAALDLLETAISAEKDMAEMWRSQPGSGIVGAQPTSLLNLRAAISKAQGE